MRGGGGGGGGKEGGGGHLGPTKLPTWEGRPTAKIWWNVQATRHCQVCPSSPCPQQLRTHKQLRGYIQLECRF